LKSGKPKLETKLTFAQPRRDQRPILFKGGRPIRSLAFNFGKGNYQKLKEQRKLLLVKPNLLKPVKIVLQGKTIKEALQGLHVDMTFNEFIRGGFSRTLYYSVLVTIQDPFGNIYKIPASDSDVPDGFDAKRFSYFPKGDGTFEKMVSAPVDRITRLQNKMSYSIRRALKDKGLTFTSPATLEKIENKEVKRITKMEKQGAPQDKIDRAKQGLDSLFRIGQIPVRSLKTITKNWKVTLYVKFELV
jgi:hypothetical protein